MVRNLSQAFFSIGIFMLILATPLHAAGSTNPSEEEKSKQPEQIIDKIKTIVGRSFDGKTLEGKTPEEKNKLFEQNLGEIKKILEQSSDNKQKKDEERSSNTGQNKPGDEAVKADARATKIEEQAKKTEEKVNALGIYNSLITVLAGSIMAGLIITAIAGISIFIAKKRHENIEKSLRNIETTGLKNIQDSLKKLELSFPFLIPRINNVVVHHGELPNCDLIRIFGYNFDRTTELLIAGKPVLFQIVSDKEINTTIPYSQLITLTNITVRTVFGEDKYEKEFKDYWPPLEIMNLTPPLANGGWQPVNGSGFTPKCEVKNNNKLLDKKYISPNELMINYEKSKTPNEDIKLRIKRENDEESNEFHSKYLS
jgi:hypothetical protein